MLISQLCFIPDADMFMTGAQWPEYHAVLRAFFEGPILLADKPGASDVKIVRKLIGRSPENVYETVTAPENIRLLARNVWERFGDAGEGPSIKGTSYFPDARSASIVLWNSRQDALYNSSDIIFEADIIDALDFTNNTVTSTKEIALWPFTAGKAVVAALNTSELDQNVGSSKPILSVSLAPEAMEIITVAPLQDVGNFKIASLGLIDKYAGLAAIVDSKVIDNKLSSKIVFDGILGFLVSTDAKTLEGKISLTVDGIPTPLTAIKKEGNLHLLQVDLAEAPTSQGKQSWTVEIATH